jgi:hypothetical protein
VWYLFTAKNFVHAAGGYSIFVLLASLYHKVPKTKAHCTGHFSVSVSPGGPSLKNPPGVGDICYTAYITPVPFRYTSPLHDVRLSYTEFISI